VAAVLNATCCVIPIVLLTLGFTNLGLFAVLMRYRPITLTISFLVLAAAFYVVYRPQAEGDCANGTCSPQSLRRQRLLVWLLAVLMLLFTLVPLLPVTMKM
jgi:hypothetical protein